MKALAVLAACLCLSLPAQAFVHGGPHFPGGHHGHGHHHGHGAIDLLQGAGGPLGGTPAEPAPVIEPVAEPVAVPYCPSPPPRPKTGPHIIYIGEKPTIHAPQVIYGTQ